MTISSTSRKAGPYSGNDVAVAFSFAFKVFSTADVVVYFTSTDGVESVLVLGTNYSISLNSDQDANPGGTVTLTTALATGTKLTLTSSVAELQPVTLTNQGGFYPKVINDSLDRATIQIQQLAEKIGRALVWPISSLAASLPTPEASKFIGWNATADSLVNLSGVAVGDAQTVSITQAGTGAVTRSVQDKLRESANPNDYSTFANYTTATGPGKGLWTDGVAVVPGETENGRFHYLRDRVLIGDAANYNGIHWNGTIPATVQPDGTLDGKVAGCSFLTNRFKGAFQYLETRGQMVVESSRGCPAIVGATQTSDATENTAAIGVASIAISNKSTGVQGCWAYYGVAIRDANTPTGIGASCAEFHVSNMINDSPQYDGYMTSAPNGYTSVLHLAQGGEHTQASQGNLTDYDVSAALVLTRFKGVNGGAFLKGIVFHSQSLAGCNIGGTPGGIGIAMDMARGHQIQWRFAQGDAGVSSVIRCDGTGHYNQPRLIMSSGAFAIKQLDTSEVEQPAFQVLLPTLGAGDGVNGVFINCQKSGAGFVGISAFGVDTNLDLFLSAKGTGTIKTGYATTVAITPASFSASRKLAIKDSSGTTYYVPCSSTAW